MLYDHLNEDHLKGANLTFSSKIMYNTLAEYLSLILLLAIPDFPKPALKLLALCTSVLSWSLGSFLKIQDGSLFPRACRISPHLTPKLKVSLIGKSPL